MNFKMFHYPILALTVCATAAPALADGDAGRGKQLYQVCATCHGDDARGNPDTQAPQLAGQYDWYLTRQLHNFKEGIRGVHPQDLNGAVMKPMAETLPDDQAIEDVVAYIVTKRPKRHD